MPVYQPQVQVVQPTRQQPAQQQPRYAKSSVYLPPMPEMLKPQGLPASKPATAGAKPNQPVIRGQEPEEATRRSSVQLGAPSKMSIPAPEALGLVTNSSAGAPPTNSVDWNTARNRLDQLGATFYRLEKAAEGGFRFSCTIPYLQDRSRQRQFDIQAANEPEAIRLAMQQVEQWQASQK